MQGESVPQIDKLGANLEYLHGLYDYGPIPAGTQKYVQDGERILPQRKNVQGFVMLLQLHYFEVKF